MESKHILLTAFRGTSAELLVKGLELSSQCRVLYLPNDKGKDSELLMAALEQEHFAYIISLGQRPNIKDKVHVETKAKKGEYVSNTDFDCVSFKEALEQNGLPAKLSYNAGTSFCNELYWNGLRYIEEKKIDTKMVFVHVPFEKNISEMEDFRKKILDVLWRYHYV